MKTNALIENKSYGLRICKSFNILRLYVLMSFLILSSYFGWYFVDKANNYGQEVGVIDWNVESYNLLGAISILYAILQLFMIAQFIIHDFSTKLSLVPKGSYLEVENRNHSLRRIRASDIDFVTIKKVGTKHTIFPWDGYCKIRLRSGEEIYITSAIIRMDDLYEFFRIGNRKVVQSSLFTFLPMRNRKTATNKTQPQS